MLLIPLSSEWLWNLGQVFQFPANSPCNSKWGCPLLGTVDSPDPHKDKGLGQMMTLAAQPRYEGRQLQWRKHLRKVSLCGWGRMLLTSEKCPVNLLGQEELGTSSFRSNWKPTSLSHLLVSFPERRTGRENLWVFFSPNWVKIARDVVMLTYLISLVWLGSYGVLSSLGWRTQKLTAQPWHMWMLGANSWRLHKHCLPRSRALGALLSAPVWFIRHCLGSGH